MANEPARAGRLPQFYTVELALENGTQVTRDAVQAALARVRAEAADPEINLMPALIDAVGVYATLGELMAAMGDVFGRHVEVPTI